MASNYSSGAPYGSSGNQHPTNADSGDLAAAAEMEQKKRKRILSNRESARRSRMRKQKHLEDLEETAERLREEKGRLAAGISSVLRRSSAVEAENSVLRTRMEELRASLRCLRVILDVVDDNARSWSSGAGGGFGGCAAVISDEECIQMIDCFVKPWEMGGPMAASQYC